MELSKEFTFEAAHVLPKHKGKCSRLHGHSWLLRVFVEGDIDPQTGFVMDYADIKAVMSPIIEQLDHKFLGQFDRRAVGVRLLDALKHDEVPEDMPMNFYPSSENLLIWIADQIGEKLINGDTDWSKLELEETCTSKAVLTYEEYVCLCKEREKAVANTNQG